MKNDIVSAATCLSLIAVPVAFAGSLPGTGLAGSGHDFPESRCESCHITHRPTSKQGLWSPTLIKPLSQPRNPSTLCLSCHDGVTAAEMEFNHPVGIAYNEEDEGVGENNNNRLRKKESRFSGTNTSIEQRLWISPNHAENLIITCVTCHDPHNKDSCCDDSWHNSLLIASNDSSFCTSCHIW